MNYKIYELNTKIFTLQILAQKSKKNNCITKKIVSKNITNIFHYLIKRKVNNFPLQKYKIIKLK